MHDQANKFYWCVCEFHVFTNSWKLSNFYSIIQQFNDCEAFGEGLVGVYNVYGGCHKHLCLVTIM